jgi:hypothetical protein
LVRGEIAGQEGGGIDFDEGEEGAHKGTTGPRTTDHRTTEMRE